MDLQLSTLGAGAAPLASDGGAPSGGAARNAGAALAAALAAVETGAPARLAAVETRTASASRASRARAAGTGYAKASKTSTRTTAKASTAKKATSPSKATSSSSTSRTSATPKDLSFLSDPKLSVEEKLFRFMQYYAAKYDAQLDEKMKAIAGKQTSAGGSGSTSSTKKKKGLFGKIGGALKGFFPVVGIGLDLLQNKTVQGLLKQVSGPVLAAGATALGFPQLAPVLLKAGPEVAGALASIAKELDAGDDAKSSSSSSSSKSSSSSSSAGAQDLSQADAMELQRIQEKQKEMFALVSNMLRSMHDAKMAVINNVRS